MTAPIDVDKVAPAAVPAAPTQEDGTPVHYELTPDEVDGLRRLPIAIVDNDGPPALADEVRTALDQLSEPAREALLDEIVHIACIRGHRALDDMVTALAGPEGSTLGLLPEAFADEELRCDLQDHHGDWVDDVRSEVGNGHFGCG